MKLKNKIIVSLITLLGLTNCNEIKENNVTDKSTKSDKDTSTNQISQKVDLTYFDYGSYPQTRVDNETLIASLNFKASTLPTSNNNYNWISYDYYYTYGNRRTYMWYQDINYNSNKFRGVYFDCYRPDSVGEDTFDASETGTYQDDNGYYRNKIYWFKYEPIKWKVLSISNDAYFVTSSMVLDAQHYYSKANNGYMRKRTPYDSSKTASVYDNNYRFSDIRGWLNVNFLNTAFSDNEMNYITNSFVDNSISTTFSSTNIYSCDNTNDKIFLMSYKDLANTSYFASDNERKCYATDYAKCQGIYANKYNLNSSSSYYLRSPYYSNNENGDSRKVSYCDYEGKIVSNIVTVVGNGDYDMDDKRGNACYCTSISGVRPALNVLQSNIN